MCSWGCWQVVIESDGTSSLEERFCDLHFCTLFLLSQSCSIAYAFLWCLTDVFFNIHLVPLLDSVRDGRKRSNLWSGSRVMVNVRRKAAPGRVAIVTSPALARPFTLPQIAVQGIVQWSLWSFFTYIPTKSFTGCPIHLSKRILTFTKKWLTHFSVFSRTQIWLRRV